MKIFTLIALFISSLVSHAATVTNATRQMADPLTAGTRPLSMLGSSLNLDRAVLLKRALASSNHVVLAGSGDSVGDSVLNALFAEIAPWLGTNGYGCNAGSSLYYETNGGAAYLRSPISDAAATNWFQDYREIASGGTMTWEPQQLCDTIHVYYVAGTPNAGTFKLLTSTNGAAFTDASNVTVSATYGGAVVTLTVPEGLWRVRAEGLTGTNVIIGARMLGSRRGVHRVGLASSGVSGVEIFRVHTNVLHTVFAHVAPHALFVEEKSDAAFHSTYWPNWLRLRAALPNTDFIWLGTTPVAVDDASYSVAQNAVDWSWCFTNGIPYFDSYSVFGSFLNMSNKCGYVDDTHPSDLANVVRTREFLRQFSQPTWITRRGVPAFMSETNYWAYQQTFIGGALMNGLRVTNELEVVGATATLELRDRSNPTGTFDRTDIYREDDRLKIYDTGAVTPLVDFYTTGGIGYLIPNPSWRGTLGFTLGTADDPFRANLSDVTIRQATGSTSNLLTLADSNGVARVTVSSNGTILTADEIRGGGANYIRLINGGFPTVGAVGNTFYLFGSSLALVDNSRPGITFASNAVFGWSGGGSHLSADTLVYRDSAGVLGVTNLSVRNNLNVSNNVWVAGDVSASTFTDRSTAPDTLADALKIVRSQTPLNGKIDHAKLDPLVWGKKTVYTPTGRSLTNVVTLTNGTTATNITAELRGDVVPDQSKRDLSMTISALSLVVASQEQRIADLEENVNILLGLAGVIGVGGAAAAYRNKKKATA